MLFVPVFQLRLGSPAERPFGFANGPTLEAVEVLMDLHARLDVNILEGSCVDEPLAVGDDLGANEIPSVLCLPDLGKLVLEDRPVVEVASLSGIWIQQAYLRDAAYDEVEKSGEEQVDQRQRIWTKNKVCLSTMLWKDCRLEKEGKRLNNVLLSSNLLRVSSFCANQKSY
jgi:hypothetical protein